jgi:hypothetical protein
MKGAERTNAMPKKNDVLKGDQRWAQFRFSIIGRLLASPPARGQLKNQLEELASKQWQHPITGEMFKLGASTIERWYYRSLNEVQDPVGILSRKLDPIRKALMISCSVCTQWERLGVHN